MPNSESLLRIRREVQDLTESSSFVEFRHDKQHSVGVGVKGMRNNKIGIIVRDNEPVIHPKGDELFPYKGLIVVYRTLVTPTVKEVQGVQIRNQKGILVEWERSRGIPDREQRRGKKLKIPPVIDLEMYEDFLQSVDEKTRHDQYGRTTDEQERENAVTASFVTETHRLLHSQTGYTEVNLHLSSDATTQFESKSTSYNLRDRHVRIDELRRASDGGMSAEVRFTPWNDNPIEIYHVREQDNRLGMRFIGKPNHPVGSAKGEEVVHLLKSLS